MHTSSEQLSFETIYRYLPVGVIIARNREMIECNERALHLFGAERSDILGSPFSILYPAQRDFRRIGREIAPLLSKRAAFTHERIMRRIDGSHFWVTVCGYAFNTDRPYELAMWCFWDSSAQHHAADPTTSLTPRERQIATLLVDGKTSKEIGRELAISYRTVEIHRASLLKKYSVKSTEELLKHLVSY